MSLSAKYVYNTLIKNDMLHSRSSIYMCMYVCQEREREKRKGLRRKKEHELISLDVTYLITVFFVRQVHLCITIIHARTVEQQDVYCTLFLLCPNVAEHNSKLGRTNT